MYFSRFSFLIKKKSFSHAKRSKFSFAAYYELFARARNVYPKVFAKKTTQENIMRKTKKEGFCDEECDDESI